MKPKHPLTGVCRSPNQLISNKKYYSSKRGHISAFRSHAQQRAKKQNIPFDLTIDYLLSIASDNCPVFKQEFRWGRHKGKPHDFTPSLDRIIPELGYVEGNVAFISNKANRIKNNAQEKELYAVADWLHSARKGALKNAKKKSIT
jgi:hypothetical protein